MQPLPGRIPDPKGMRVFQPASPPNLVYGFIKYTNSFWLLLLTQKGVFLSAAINLWTTFNCRMAASNQQQQRCPTSSTVSFFVWVISLLFDIYRLQETLSLSIIIITVVLFAARLCIIIFDNTRRNNNGNDKSQREDE